jgi:hypothetical protein
VPVSGAQTLALAAGRNRTTASASSVMKITSTITCANEWRLRLRRRQRLQEPQLLKRLNDGDKHVEIERHDGGDDVEHR